jgi:hypothetical protein
MVTMTMIPEPPAMPDPMPTAEAARRLGVSPGYLTNLRCWGTGPRWRRAGARGVRYAVADLDEWRDRRQSGRKSVGEATPSFDPARPSWIDAETWSGLDEAHRANLARLDAHNRACAAEHRRWERPCRPSVQK